MVTVATTLSAATEATTAATAALSEVHCSSLILMYTVASHIYVVELIQVPILLIMFSN